MTPRWRLRRAIVLVVLITVLAGLAVGQAVALAGRRATERDRDQVLTVARRAAADLTTMSPATVDTAVRRVLDDSTGGFHDQYTEQAAQLRRATAAAGISSAGTVTAAGLVGADPDRAVALVAVVAQVSTAADPIRRPHPYRMRLTLERTAGTWLVSALELTP